jgi:osmoprotectant transport system ATP-binding protein
MILVQGISKSYGGIPVLESISHLFQQDQTHVILGSSGCGKSTLLRIVMGITSPDHGSVWIDHQQLTAQSQRQIVERMGYVTQEGGLFPHLTARDNIVLKASLLKWPTPRIYERVTELTNLMKLSPSLLQKFPAELSSGQRQRVSLMRALMLDPPILLLDEPLGALDPIVRNSLQSELKGLFDRLNKTVILVTHDLSEATFLGDTIILMNHGTMVQKGRFQDFVRRPTTAFVTEFINAQRPPEELRLNA